MENNFPFDAGDGEETYWVIMSTIPVEPCYWKRAVGWVYFHQATQYTDREKIALYSPYATYVWKRVE